MTEGVVERIVQAIQISTGIDKQPLRRACEQQAVAVRHWLTTQYWRSGQGAAAERRDLLGR